MSHLEQAQHSLVCDAHDGEGHAMFVRLTKERLFVHALQNMHARHKSVIWRVETTQNTADASYSSIRISKNTSLSAVEVATLRECQPDHIWFECFLLSAVKLKRLCAIPIASPLISVLPRCNHVETELLIRYMSHVPRVFCSVPTCILSIFVLSAEASATRTQVSVTAGLSKHWNERFIENLIKAAREDDDGTVTPGEECYDKQSG